jgi:hypothetical protein
VKGWRGVLGGALALVTLQVLVTSNQTSRLAGLFTVPADLAEQFLNPNVPAIPDRRK